MREEDNRLWQSLTCSAQDGLTLFGQDYNPHEAKSLPVVCLPGMARHSADFHEIALQLSRDAAFKRRVLAIDYRGRGRSRYDKDWTNYTVQIEAADVLNMLVVAGIEQAILLGTSRGGLVAMALGILRPSLIKGVILNDIGPVIDGQGLARIRQYLGKLPPPRSWDEAVEILKTYANRRFPALDDRDWRKMAERTWSKIGDKFIPDYDPALNKGLQALDLERPLPPLWDAFLGLRQVPMLSLRGEHSDLFLAETQAEMARQHPNCTTMTVEGQGHAPLLDDAPSLMAITRFCATIDPRR